MAKEHKCWATENMKTVADILNFLIEKGFCDSEIILLLKMASDTMFVKAFRTVSRR